MGELGFFVIALFVFAAVTVAKGVRIVATFPDDTHSAIRYPMALTQHAHPNATRWLNYLRGTEARRVFQEQGFTAP